MLEYAFLVVNMLSLLLLIALLIWRELHFLAVHNAYRDDVGKLLDRLMARDLPEYVQAGAYGSGSELPQPMGIDEFSDRLIGG